MTEKTKIKSFICEAVDRCQNRIDNTQMENTEEMDATELIIELGL